MIFVIFQSSDWTLFFGRFHPILVHFPIGFLLLGFLLELAGRSGKVEVSRSSLTFIYLLSAIGATFACIAGYLLSLSGGYEEELLSSHMWRGIGVALFSWLLWAIRSDRFAEKLKKGSVLVTPLLVFLVILVFSTGHLGGALTHGDGYVFQYAPEPFRTWFGGDEAGTVVEIKPLANVSQAVVYHDIVQPILDTKCVQCHGAKKSKGDLRLDNLSQIMKGGENGMVVEKGKGKTSELVARALLPLSDDGHMPPKGKQQLTDEQILLLTWWIDNGADGEKKVADFEADELVAKALEGLGETGDAAPSPGRASETFLAALNPAPASAESVENLRKAGLLVSTLASENNCLEVSAVNAPDFSDEKSKLLVQIKDQLVWLKLGRTGITDEALKNIGQLTNLTKLNLEYNAVSSKGLENLLALQHLEYLNVIGTKLDDAGLNQLAGIKSLKHIYIWQSGVTESGLAAIREKRPDLVITGGMTEKEVADFIEIGKKGTDPEK